MSIKANAVVFGILLILLIIFVAHRKRNENLVWPKYVVQQEATNINDTSSFLELSIPLLRPRRMTILEVDNIQQRILKETGEQRKSTKKIVNNYDGVKLQKVINYDLDLPQNIFNHADFSTTTRKGMMNGKGKGSKCDGSKKSKSSKLCPPSISPSATFTPTPTTFFPTGLPTGTQEPTACIGGGKGMIGKSTGKGMMMLKTNGKGGKMTKSTKICSPTINPSTTNAPSTFAPSLCDVGGKGMMMGMRTSGKGMSGSSEKRKMKMSTKSKSNKLCNPTFSPSPFTDSTSTPTIPSVTPTPTVKTVRKPTAIPAAIPSISLSTIMPTVASATVQPTTGDTTPTAPGATSTPTTIAPSTIGATSPPTTIDVTMAPTATRATAAPIATAATSTPAAAGATGAPITTAATEIPTTAGATGIPTTTVATTPPTATGTTAIPTAIGATEIPTATGATTVPIATGTTGAPIATAATEIPTTTGATGIPTSTDATTPPTATGTTTIPTAIGATEIPTVTGATTLPIATGTTGAPIATAATELPTTAGATGIPSTTAATTPPTATVATEIPTTAGATEIPTVTGATAAPTASGSTLQPLPATEAPTAGAGPIVTQAPTVAAATRDPTTAGGGVSATPFSLVYDVGGPSSPTADDLNSAATVTEAYLDRYFQDYFANTLGLVLSGTDATVVNTVSDPPTITFDYSVTLDVASGLLTTDSLDSIVETLFRQPAVSELIGDLQVNLDPANPISGASDITYTQVIRTALINERKQNSPHQPTNISTTLAVIVPHLGDARNVTMGQIHISPLRKETTSAVSFYVSYRIGNIYGPNVPYKVPVEENLKSVANCTIGYLSDFVRDVFAYDTASIVLRTFNTTVVRTQLQQNRIYYQSNFIFAEESQIAAENVDTLKLLELGLSGSFVETLMHRLARNIENDNPFSATSFVQYRATIVPNRTNSNSNNEIR